MVYFFIALVGVGFSLWGFRKLLRRWRMCPSSNELSDKTVIITGANSGIGKATALELVKRKARVILACRNINSAEEVAAEIKRETGTGNERIVVKELDLASFDSIRQFCRSVLEEESHIDILVNNAAVFNCPLSRTVDGLEMQMGVNHFGHFLLTNLLLDRLHVSGSLRIIVVSSHYYSGGKIDFSDINWTNRPYDGQQAYTDSKLANSLFAWELNRRLKERSDSQVTVLALTPGSVATSITRHSFPSWFRTLVIPWTVLLGIRDPFEGCQSVVYCCVEPSLTYHSGAYIDNCAIKSWNKIVLVGDTATRLWELSEKVTGVNGKSLD